MTTAVGDPLRTLVAAYYRAQQQLAADVADGAQDAWSAAGPAQWREAAPRLAVAVLLAQTVAATNAQEYVNAALLAQGVEPDPVAEVSPSAFAGIAQATLPLDAMLSSAPLTTYYRSRRAGLMSTEAQRRALLTLITAAMTAVQDAGRSAEGVAVVAANNATGYARMLTPPSCSRCVILAGRIYRRATPFRRHPRCDCRHVPVAEDSDDLTTNPRRYFRSLPANEQDQVFGVAGAQAIRDGADINQVVNARQGITTVNAYGVEVTATTTGTTRRALFGGYEIQPDGTLRRRGASEMQRIPGDRYSRARTPRLMPEEIYRLADENGWDRVELLRQLRRFAYLL
ncbi:VG15 protein [Saccharopolyspora sp. NPDC003752]